MPTIKDLEQLEKSQATLKEILKVNMLEPFKDSDLNRDYILFFGVGISTVSVGFMKSSL